MSEERIHHDGLCFRAGALRLEPEAGGVPALRLELARGQYPEGREVFQPLRLPDRAALVVRGRPLRGLRRATVKLEVALRPGLYNLPLGDGPPCQVELGEGARAFARLELGDPPGAERGAAGPIVRTLDLHFAPALVIDNVLSTLSSLQGVVEDRLLGLFRPLLPRVPPWLRQLGGIAMGSADGTARVLLEGASARPRTDSGPPTLRFAFSGRVRWLDRLETEFEGVTLPASILPIPYASLEQLLSSHPLASAELIPGATDPLELLQTLCDAAGEIEGELEAELGLPALEVVGTTLDGTALEARLRQGGTVSLRGELSGVARGASLELRCPSLALRGASGSELALEVAAGLALDLSPGRRPLAERVGGALELTVAEGSRWHGLELALRSQGQVARGELDLQLRLDELAPRGALGLSYDGEALTLRPASELALDGRLRVPEERPFHASGAHEEWRGGLGATLSARILPLPDGDWQASTKLEGELASQATVRLASGLPELGIAGVPLEVEVELALSAELELGLRRVGASAFEAELAQSCFELRARRLEVKQGPRHLRLPPDTLFSGRVIDGALTPAGVRGLALDVRWDLHGQPCLLHHGEQAVSLLTEALRQGQMTLILEPSGKIRFAGDREGLYGARYFNTLLNPAGDPERLMDLLLSEDAILHVLGALSVFAPSMAEALADLRALLLATRTILRREGIREPKDFIPRRRIARTLSLLLSGDDRLQGRLEALVRRVTEGKGLDLVAAKELLLGELAEFDVDYEVNALLSWLGLVLGPTEPIAPARAEAELPLALDPGHRGGLEGLPSASEIYAAVNRGALDPAWAERLAELAPELTRQQLAFILARAGHGWSPRSLARLRYAREVKERVARIGEGMGGIEYALEPWVIASFLGEAVGPLPGLNHPGALDPDAWPPPCALGASEVATLLQAGLASGRQGRRTQVNNRLLLELLRGQPATFTRAVLIELAHGSARVLSSVLYAFLDQDQDQLVEELDLCAFLGERLDLPVPRQRDFMAGGHKARQSYYEALSRLADLILEEAGPYLARKAHLQRVQHAVAPELAIPPSLEALAARAEESVARADELSASCGFDEGRRAGPRARARRAYESAFRSCARLLEREPRAFQLPFLRRFWIRNEEALRVLSVVRAFEEDLDDVRRWLEVQTCLLRREPPRLDDEQALLATVVSTLYYREEDRRALLADPLVRLLIDPPPGRYDFSIVSAMGVITEGKEGAELEDAYRRLEERRGVKVQRAATGTARSLEFNAARIIEEIERCETPYGLIGYSQGCANILLAESHLRGGTPEQQRLLDGLVGRNFLFSAANGSAHGTAGVLKFARALVLGERHLKHYQAVFSWEAIKAALRVARAVLDSRVFVATLGGAHSLSFERARQLHREGQFLDRVPTTLTRGITTALNLPETLEFLYHILGEQTYHAEQDTQVLVTDAVGYSTRVVNERTRVLERCSMTTAPQWTHHWAPLTREIEFVTTERDLERAVYQSPKDRLVWPWVEVNARFGRIRTR
jgi:hypothetical protein